MEDYALVSIFLALFGVLIEMRVKVAKLCQRYDDDHKEKKD